MVQKKKGGSGWNFIIKSSVLVFCFSVWCISTVKRQCDTLASVQPSNNIADLIAMVNIILAYFKCFNFYCTI